MTARETIIRRRLAANNAARHRELIVRTSIRYPSDIIELLSDHARETLHAIAHPELDTR
jgi:hypothetical protein